ncbi:hypothetical protein evm_010067 [Chilo suppressalis]|nr:hypothetical protein evm_010067 [Chilo suppressalis]
MQSFHRNGESVWLLGDSGYPQKPWLMTPYSDPAPGTAAESYNNTHHRARCAAQSSTGTWSTRARKEPVDFQEFLRVEVPKEERTLLTLGRTIRDRVANSIHATT